MYGSVAYPVQEKVLRNDNFKGISGNKPCIYVRTKLAYEKTLSDRTQ